MESILILSGASEAILKWAGHGKSLTSSESTFALLILSDVIEKDGNLACIYCSERNRVKLFWGGGGGGGPI